MRAVVQRARAARVEVDGVVVGAIDAGLVAFVGAARGDEERDLAYVVDKVVNLRVLEDDAGKMSRSILDASAGLLVVSQFTLLADLSRGRRPSFVDAMAPDEARAMLERFVAEARARGVARVETGVFGADMRVFVENDGPVTILVDSRKPL